MEAIVHRSLRLETSMKKVEKSSFIRKIDLRFRHLQLHLWEWRFFDNYICFFLFFLRFLRKRFAFSDLLGLFYFVRYLNRAVWPSMWCHFLDISCVKQFWGPVEATFSSWILSSRQKCARQLRASSLNHQECCFCHLQTWFVEGNVVRQLDSSFLSFWLASWGGPKLKTFADNVGRQRRKIYRRNFANIVAIQTPPLFF